MFTHVVHLLEYLLVSYKFGENPLSIFFIGFQNGIFFPFIIFEIIVSSVYYLWKTLARHITYKLSLFSLILCAVISLLDHSFEEFLF